MLPFTEGAPIIPALTWLGIWKPRCCYEYGLALGFIIEFIIEELGSIIAAPGVV